jgi:2-oxoglutarate ferredoxin oxidoreductase subunit delta
MAKGLVVLDENRCKGCGLCVVSCPTNVLDLSHARFNALGYRPVEVVRAEACTGCAVCAIVCPDVVFAVYRQRKPVKAAAAKAPAAQE